MTHAHRALLVALSVVALSVTVGHAQAPQQAGRGGPPGGRGRGGAPALPPLMVTPPKPAIANVKPVRSCESLAMVALPNTTIESAAVDATIPACVASSP